MSNLGVLDMALDEVISQNRKPRAGGRGGRGGINKSRNARPSSSKQHTGTRNVRTARTPPVRSSAPRSNSLTVSNLHFNVTEKDLYDLFGQIGALRKAFLHIGPNGKSAGIADVVFVNPNDAERAKSTYNNVELDGRPMRISSATIAAALPTTPVRRREGGNFRGQSRRGGRFNKQSRPAPNERDLDADMDSYMETANN